MGTGRMALATAQTMTKCPNVVKVGGAEFPNIILQKYNQSSQMREKFINRLLKATTLKKSNPHRSLDQTAA